MPESQSESGNTAVDAADEGATSTARRALYPPIEPCRTGWLRVSDVHELCYEESGRPDVASPIREFGWATMMITDSGLIGRTPAAARTERSFDAH